jgi:hypothetical protein
VTPIYQSPKRLKAIIPEEISSEIIVVHYNQADGTDSDIQLDAGPEFNNNKKTDIDQTIPEKGDDKVIHANVQDQFATAVMKE